MRSKTISFTLIIVAISVAAATFYRKTTEPSVALEPVQKMESLPPVSMDTVPSRSDVSLDHESVVDTLDEPLSPSIEVRQLTSSQAKDHFANGKRSHDCLHVPLTEEDYLRGLEGKNSQPSPANFQQDLKAIKRCEGVSRSISYALQQYKLAADMGDPEAMLSYGYLVVADVEPPKTFPSEEKIESYRALEQQRLDYYMKSAKAGYVDGAIRLADSYKQGNTIKRVFGKDIVLREPDIVEAYAWFYASTMARVDNAALAQWRDSLSRVLEESGRLAEAQGLGARYYEQYLFNNISE